MTETRIDSFTVSPTSGSPPFTVTIQGYLDDAATASGINGETVSLLIDGQPVDSTMTHDDAPHGLGIPGFFRFYRYFTEAGMFTVQVVYDGSGAYGGCVSNAFSVTAGTPTPTTYTLAIAVSTGGAASSSKTIYNPGEVATVAATASSTYAFDHWLVDGVRPEAPYDTANPLSLVMDSDHVVQAVFRQLSPSDPCYGVTCASGHHCENGACVPNTAPSSDVWVAVGVAVAALSIGGLAYLKYIGAF